LAECKFLPDVVNVQIVFYHWFVVYIYFCVYSFTYFYYTLLSCSGINWVRLC